MDTINEGLNAIFALASNVGYGAALIGIKTFIEEVDKVNYPFDISYGNLMPINSI